MKFFNLENKWFIRPLFLFFITYATLRAIFTEPLLDELGTFYWYIQTGFLPGNGAILDANNHILNSFISHQLYRAFGDHFFLYRLFALSCFPVYFYACRRLILNIKPSFPVILFLSLITIHWIFDYFSLTRGYGPALSFLMLAFCFIVDWNKTLKTKYFIFAIFCFAIILLSNLSFLIPVMFLFGYSILAIVIRIKEFSTKKMISVIITTLLFIAILIPIYLYIQKLKKAGALWWGSTDGLWEVTGKSLSENVFFTGHEALKYFLAALLVLILICSIINWKKTGFTAFLFKPEFWIPGLLFMCLLSFVLMAKLMKVNYPMDRVGMYLVPLFLLTFGIVLSGQKQLKWLLVLLLWFPISFIWKMNLSTTIFSPSDRIRSDFYQSMKKIIGPDDQFSSEYVVHTCYAYLTRKDEIQHLATEFNAGGDTLALGDYYLSWLGNSPSKNYIPVLKDPLTSTTLFKRIHSPKRTLIKDTIIAEIKSKEMYINLYDFHMDSSYTKKLIQTSVNASVSLQSPSLSISLIHQVSDQDKHSRLTKAIRSDWYFGSKKNYQFTFTNQAFAIQPTDKNLYIFFHNPDLQSIVIRNVRIKVYAVE